MMFFLGCIETIMDGSGLKEALSLIYALLSGETIMDGYTYARAVRANLLMHSVLSKVMYSEMGISENKEEIMDLLENSENFTPSAARIHESIALRNFAFAMENTLLKLKQRGIVL